jgi:hypothetical protein
LLKRAALLKRAGLRQDRDPAAQSLAEARTCGNGSHEMRVLLSTTAAAIRTDGATVAATLLADAVSREAASGRVNHRGSSRQVPEHEHLQTPVT